MELRNEGTNEQVSELSDESLEGISGGIQGNHDIPDGYKRVCAQCGSERVHYSVSAGGFPVCWACDSTEYIFVPK